MAWYRAGGGGIPSSLKTDMNDVLNKKFGTSIDYPPTNWAPTVNLMGPLPEKTASGAIVTFPDGADAVPLKKCEITLPASLDGYSSVDVKHTGANLLDFTVRDHFGITCEKTADGGAKMSGTATNTSYPVNWIPLTLPAGTYHIYISAVGTGMTIAYSKNGGYGGNLYTGDNVITLNAETEIGGYIRVSNGTVISEPETVYMQLSVAQADYEPYTTPTTHTAQLGRTIYGGTADVVKGQGIGECVKVKFSDLTWFTNLLNGARQFYAVLSDSKTPINNNTILDGLLCDGYNVTYANDVYLDTSVGDKISVNTGNAVQVRDYSVTTLEAFIAKTANYELVYPLATPEPFSFDPVPIDSKLGNNTLWSEQGSAEVTHRADINLALGGQ